MSTRRVLVVLAVASAPLAACFALFPLDGYGPGAGTEAGAESGADAQAPPPPPPPDAPSLDANVRPDGRIVFVTRAVFTGNFGGVDGGDTICLEAGAGAAIPGRYLAWLSDDTSSPASRFGAAFFDGGERAIVAMDGELVASSLADLADGGPHVVIAIDEHGVRVSSPEGGTCQDLADGGLVWTDTTPAGAASLTGVSADCSNWSQVVRGGGLAGGLVLDGGPNGTSSWTGACQVGCMLFAHLYCFEQP